MNTIAVTSFSPDRGDPYQDLAGRLWFAVCLAKAASPGKQSNKLSSKGPCVIPFYTHNFCNFYIAFLLVIPGSTIVQIQGRVACN